MDRDSENLHAKICRLKEEIEAQRVVQIKEKVEKNRRKLRRHIREVISKDDVSSSRDTPSKVSSLEIGNLNVCLPGSSDQKDFASLNEDAFPKSAKLPRVQRIPSYTTWIFLDRNRRMAEDQSVVGRRRIYYDQSGNEALVCSDSDDDFADLDEEKRAFTAGEDRILRVAFEEHGFKEEVAHVVSQFIGGLPGDIQEGYNELKLKSDSLCEPSSAERFMCLDKDLSSSLDSFDNLFCRRCLVFDCRLHGCSQLVYPSDKQLRWAAPAGRKPCSDHCYLLTRQSPGNLAKHLDIGSVRHIEHDVLEGNSMGSCVLSSEKDITSDAAAQEGSTTEHLSVTAVAATTDQANAGKRKIPDDDHMELVGSEVLRDSLDKKQKIPLELTSTAGEVVRYNTLGEKRGRLEGTSQWKTLEKDLCLKGIEMYGRNSCLIARNVLSGLKTCTEVSNYMQISGSVTANELDSMHCSDNCGRAVTDKAVDLSVRPRSRLIRKRGRTRRVKYSSKSNGLPSSWRRIGEQACKQYTPCSCNLVCGKDCACLNNGTCCEKYCGCSKSCRNRFRGCHCAKSQCRSRQCPCFAADRECDPDVCKNCWVSCGGGELGEPPRRGDSQCGNMRLLLRQQQRVLLARSDIAGWGAFIKNSVNKNDYLGEYTGELVSHREADKRGKIYDRANSSFLFDLNDQYVLDACRQGDKLKFANHSSKPNCYCKVMLVAGDHRVGIFAKERIEAKEELFYDYRYAPDQAPPWARRPEGSKKDDSLPLHGRPRKHQSR